VCTLRGDTQVPPYKNYPLIRLIVRDGRREKLAEREGFEPSEEVSPLTRLAGEHLRPLGHLSGEAKRKIKAPVALIYFIKTVSLNQLLIYTPFVLVFFLLV
jgi:hypothetical protein